MNGMMTGGDPLTDGMTLAWALGVALKTSALLTVTGLLTLALFRSSAALRHLAWSLAIGGVLVLPFVPLASPWSWELLPELRMASEAMPELQRSSEAVPFGEQLSEPSGPASPEAEDRDHATEKTTGEPTPVSPSWTERPSEASMATASTPGVPTGARDGGAMATGEASVTASFPLGAIALATWATVALLLMLHQLLGRFALRRITETGEPVDDAHVRWELAWSVGVAGLSRPVRVLRSDRVRVPLTWGVRRPVVLLPSESRDWCPERLRLVLHHELAHVRRMDALSDAVSRIACALHWFNPLVWWAAARLRAESEKASDDMVLESGARASEYAGHLLDLVTNLTHRRGPAGALPLVQRSEFEGRLLAILDPSRERSGARRASAFTLGSALLAAVIALGSVAPAQAAVGERDGGETDPVLEADPLVEDDLAVEENPTERVEGMAGMATDVEVVPDTDGWPPRDPSARAADAVGMTEPAGATDAGRPADAASESERPVTSESEIESVQIIDTTSVRALTQALRGDSNAEVRRTAAWALGQIEDPAATGALSDALRDDESTEVRRMAAWALGQIEDPAAAPALGEALADEEAEVRESALWALGQIEAPEAVEPLSRALSDADPGVRKTAAWALGQIESPEAVPPLSAAIDDEHPEVRSQVVWALGQIEGRESVEPLARALRDEAAEVRRQAAWALGQVESASAVDALSQALREDTDRDVRRQSAWALGQIEAEAGVRALVDGLSDTDPEVARMAAWGLGQIEPSSAPPELVEAARSSTGELRTTALWALVQIEDPAAVPALVDALQDEDADVRAQALRGLAEIGSGAAIEAIAELLQDPDPEVRAAAARALAGGRGGWNSPRPDPNPNPNPDPRPRPNGKDDGSGSGTSNGGRGSGSDSGSGGAADTSSAGSGSGSAERR